MVREDSMEAMICVGPNGFPATSDTQSSSVQPSEGKEAFVDLVERVQRDLLDA